VHDASRLERDRPEAVEFNSSYVQPAASGSISVRKRSMGSTNLAGTFGVDIKNSFSLYQRQTFPWPATMTCSFGLRGHSSPFLRFAELDLVDGLRLFRSYSELGAQSDVRLTARTFGAAVN
jgi:hypothetical protein